MPVVNIYANALKMFCCNEKDVESVKEFTDEYEYVYANPYSNANILKYRKLVDGSKVLVDIAYPENIGDDDTIDGLNYTRFVFPDGSVFYGVNDVETDEIVGVVDKMPMKG